MTSAVTFLSRATGSNFVPGRHYYPDNGGPGGPGVAVRGSLVHRMVCRPARQATRSLGVACRPLPVADGPPWPRRGRWDALERRARPRNRVAAGRDVDKPPETPGEGSSRETSYKRDDPGKLPSGKQPGGNEERPEKFPEVLKTMEMDEETLDEYEDLWKENSSLQESSNSADLPVEDPCADATPVTKDSKGSPIHDLEEALEPSVSGASTSNYGAQQEDRFVPIHSSRESTSSEQCDPWANEAGLPKPMYLLSVQIKGNEVEKDQERAEVISMSFKSGLVNSVLLEDSELPSKLLMKPAAKLRELCDSLGLRLIIENRVDVAVNAKADGVVLDQGLDLESTRNFLDIASLKRDRSPSETATARQGEVPHTVTCGRMVSNADQALAAEEECVDFVMVAPSDKTPDDASDLQAELRSIRRSTTAHVIPTHAFCLLAGGPKLVFSMGADGLQIPADKLYKLMMQQSRSYGPVKQLPPRERVIGASLLIAGGTVGAGIIALPVKTAAAGFIPSVAAMAACWLFMVTTASLLLEMSTWYGPGTNLTTMAANTLGKGGKTAVTALYLFIYGATLTAYMAEGGNFVNMALTALGYSCPIWLVVTGFSVAFGAVLFAGPDPTDKVNSLCLVVAIFAYGLLLKVAAGSVMASNLMRANWAAAPAALPVMVVAFTFHNIVPSLLGYLGSSQLVMQAILVGSGIPFAMYLVWELVILGTVAPGTSLTSASQIVEQLSAATGGQAGVFVEVFSCFAIITSFLGVGMGCIDFLKDLLMRKAGAFSGQVAAGSKLETLVPLVTAILPPLVVACAAPHIFYSALEFSGTFRLVLFGILPVMMTWKGRYFDKNKPFVFGGKLMLSTVMCVAIMVLGVEWGGKLRIIPRAVA